MPPSKGPLLAWTAHAWADYLHWQAHDAKKLKRVNLLIQAALRDPCTGEGKPEALRFQYTGLWSRRIDQEHRLVYVWDAPTNTLTILQCRYHYTR